MERKIRGFEGKIEEMDILVKENAKSNRLLTQDIQEVNDTMKRKNLRKLGVEVEEETTLKYAEISNKITE